MFDPEMTLHTMSTDELVRLHNVLSGGSWLKVVRRVLSWRNVHDAEKIRRGVGVFSYSVIEGRA